MMVTHSQLYMSAHYLILAKERKLLMVKITA